MTTRILVRKWKKIPICELPVLCRKSPQIINSFSRAINRGMSVFVEHPVTGVWEIGTVTNVDDMTVDIIIERIDQGVRLRDDVRAFKYGTTIEHLSPDLGGIAETISNSETPVHISEIGLQFLEELEPIPGDFFGSAEFHVAVVKDRRYSDVLALKTFPTTITSVKSYFILGLIGLVLAWVSAAINLAFLCAVERCMCNEDSFCFSLELQLVHVKPQNSSK